MGKNPLASKTVWGVIVQMIAFVLATQFGVDVDEETQATVVNHTMALISAGTELVGMILTIYGRFKANKPLKVV